MYGFLNRPMSWIVFGAIVLAAAVGLWLLFRSFKKWKTPPPTAPEAKQAEARLWSTKVMDQH
jgi:cytoskeletal protein RodZ